MSSDLKELTSLRFFAAMWVVLYHYWPSLGLATPTLLGKGYLGVELFFVLSGFILSHVYLPKFGVGRFAYRAFLWARVARIYPVHLVTLTVLGLFGVAAAASGLTGGHKLLVASSLVPNLLLVQAWGLAPGGGWNHPSWSLSAEWFAYLAFPAFAWAAWRMREHPRLAFALACVLVVGLQEGFRRVAGFELTQATVAWGALRIVPCFALGCAAYLIWRTRPAPSRVKALGVCSAALATTLGAAALNTPDWVEVIAFGGLIVGLACLASLGSSPLAKSLWVYLGEASFALYMVCIPWQLLVANLAHKVLNLRGESLPLTAWLLMTIGALPAAMVLHHAVERPARTFLRRLSPGDAVPVRARGPAFPARIFQTT